MIYDLQAYLESYQQDRKALDTPLPESEGEESLEIRILKREKEHAPAYRQAYTALIAFLETNCCRTREEIEQFKDLYSASIQQKRQPGGPYEGYDAHQGKYTMEAIVIQECNTILHTINLNRFYAAVTAKNTRLRNR